ncbi:MAG: hypothetical protein IT353_19360 [Gemmatimonadaceae bacterium]|nr:hypothetical protein [Gemmatimonadaceae bacterium]
MREPQATSTLGTFRTTTLVGAALALLCVATPTTSGAQIRGSAPRAPQYGWWISGGASAVTLTDITDGASQTVWRFGKDPLWQYRATIEKALDEFTTIGVSAGYGRVNVGISSVGGLVNASLPTSCDTGCAATTELWTGMAQFRSGGGPGFHTLFEASGGATVFRGFKTQTDAIAIPGIARSLDLSGTLGAGFAYALTPGFVVALVQDFGIGFHAKADLPEGAARTWRVRNTRASIRMSLGGR